MTPLERRASVSLASIYALRMLGLFLVLPVLALEARKFPGGDDPALIGLAMGIYGLTQALLQIPFGVASDRLGRKRVIVAGLLVFAAGSFIAASAHSLSWLIAGRALQGAGAVSAAVTALLADQTRDEVRTKALALVGASISLVFALSLVISPLLLAHIGLAGLFAMTGTLALAGVAVVIWWVPPEPAKTTHTPRNLNGSPHRPILDGMREVLRHPALLRLDFGVFVLYAVQLGMWMAVPAMLVQAGLSNDRHWQVYLPVVLGSFVVMGLTLFPLEKRGYLRAVFLVSVALVAAVQAALFWVAQGTPGTLGTPGGASTLSTPGVGMLALLLFLFFCGFNVLEASQPSMASRAAPAHARGAALGVYNTLQSLGLFAGGLAGGWLVKHWGPQGLFGVCAGGMLLWLCVAWPMRAQAATVPKTSDNHAPKAA